MSGKDTELGQWLGGVLGGKPKAEPIVDIYELAVTQGLAAQVTRGKGPVDWFAVWAAKLTDTDIQTIRARREAEFATLREEVELLLGGEPEKWTPAERAYTETVGRRLTAVSLVLDAARGAKGDGQRATTTFLPKKEDSEAASTVAA